MSFIRAARMANVQRSLDPSTTLGDAVHAMKRCLSDANVSLSNVNALVVGNMLSPVLQKQSQVAAMLATEIGYTGPTFSIDAACGSGGAAIYMGNSLVKSGASNVLVLGFEHLRHPEPSKVTQGLAGASHWPTEGGAGETFVSLNGSLMAEYCKRYSVLPEDLFSIAHAAHKNAVHNEHALYRSPVESYQAYLDSKRIHPSLRLFDASAICNGSAALLLSSSAGDDASSSPEKPVQIIGAGAATDSLRISLRPDPLILSAARDSAAQAFSQSHLEPSHMDIVEVHDAYTIMAALCLESCGFIDPGTAHSLGKQGAFNIDGQFPICSFGGLLRRGHPVGASGVYQAAEAWLQLQGRAPSAVQQRDPKHAFIQSVGGAGSSVYTHILSAAQ